MKRLRQLAAGLLYIIGAYSWVGAVLLVLLLALAGAIDNPVLNPQNYGAP